MEHWGYEERREFAKWLVPPDADDALFGARERVAFPTRELGTLLPDTWFPGSLGLRAVYRCRAGPELLARCMLLGAVPCAHLALVLPLQPAELLAEEEEMRLRREEDRRREDALLELLEIEEREHDPEHLARHTHHERAKVPGKPLFIDEARGPLKPSPAAAVPRASVIEFPLNPAQPHSAPPRPPPRRSERLRKALQLLS